MNKKKDPSKVTVARSTLVVLGLIAVISPYVGIYLWGKISPRLSLGSGPVRGCVSIKLTGSESDDGLARPSSLMQLDVLMSGEDYAALPQQLDTWSDIDLDDRFLFATGHDYLINSGTKRYVERRNSISTTQSVTVWFDEGTCSENWH